MIDTSNENPFSNSKSPGIKLLLGVELSGKPETLPKSFLLPNDLLKLSKLFCEIDPLQEKMALVDYVGDISSFIPREVHKGGTYDPKKCEVNSNTIWGNFLTIQSRALKGEPLIELHNHPDLIQIGDGYSRKGKRLPDAFTGLALRVPSSSDLSLHLTISHGLIDIISTNHGGSIVVPWSEKVRSRRPFGLSNISESYLDKAIHERTSPVLDEGIERFIHRPKSMEYFINTTLKQVTYSAYADLLKKFECSIYFADDISKPFILAK